MDERRFDALARALGAGASRRGLLARLSGAFASGAVAVAGAPVARAQPGPACREAGHPCEGNQECCEGLICCPSGPGAADRCTPAGETCPDPDTAVQGVVALPALEIAVECAFDEEADQTICECAATAERDAATVTRVVLPPADVCAEVVGGEHEFLAPARGKRAVGYASAEGEAVLTLVLAGRVEAQGSAVYWCTTEAGLVPVQGPGLVRVADDRDDATGAVEVRVAACDMAAPDDGDDVDWYGRCATPADRLPFALMPAEDGEDAEEQTGTTNAAGRLRFGRLSPGNYRLSRPDGTWCHAESDSVNADGEVVVEAGQRATVWIFTCPAE